MTPHLDTPDTLLVLAALSLLPFLAIMVTSFTKIVVVLGILRSALGTSQTPPSTVLTGLALLLTFYVMAPVGEACLEDYRALPDGTPLLERAAQALVPLRGFLSDHARDEDLRLFAELAGVPEGARSKAARPPSLRLLVPAFLLGELREAFRIGFLLFLPFLVVDLVVSALTLSLGMHMLSPTTIALPLKLLLFVSADGWRLLCEALVRGYLPGATH